MRLESDAEVAVGFVVLLVFAILMLTGGVAWYHYGYFEGKVSCQERLLKEK